MGSMEVQGERSGAVLERTEEVTTVLEVRGTFAVVVVVEEGGTAVRAAQALEERCR